MKRMRSGKRSVGRPRGRPRQFDPEAALAGATRLFWERGFAATSLDDLATAMRMKRPSIANAFGDKEAVYRQTLARFVGQMKREAGGILFGEADLELALRSFYYAALDVYFATVPAPGCFVMCTAPVEAFERPEVRRDLARLIAELDGLLAARFDQARREGRSSRTSDPEAAARFAQAVLHSLAIRARSGASKTSLRSMARGAARMLAAPEGSGKR